MKTAYDYLKELFEVVIEGENTLSEQSWAKYSEFPPPLDSAEWKEWTRLEVRKKNIKATLKREFGIKDGLHWTLYDEYISSRRAEERKAQGE